MAVTVRATGVDSVIIKFYDDDGGLITERPVGSMAVQTPLEFQKTDVCMHDKEFKTRQHVKHGPRDIWYVRWAKFDSLRHNLVNMLGLVLSTTSPRVLLQS